MPAPFKKSVFLTTLVVIPMLLTNTALSNIHGAEIEKELLLLGVILAGTIVYVVKVKPIIEKN